MAGAIFEVLGLLNVLVFMLGNWAFKILVNAFKGPLKSDWNRSMVCHYNSGVLCWTKLTLYRKLNLMRI